MTVVQLEDTHKFKVGSKRERLPGDVQEVAPPGGTFHLIAHAVDVGLEAREAGVDDSLELGSDEDVIEATDDGADGFLHDRLRLGVDVDAVRVLRRVDRSQQSLHLLYVGVYQQVERDREASFLG